MPAKFARYVFHVMPILTADGVSGQRDLDRVLLWDIAIAALESRQLPTLMLSDHWQALDGYLRLRPERFDTLAQLLAQRQAWLGSWYWTPRPSDSAELLIRNLLLGRRSASVFGLIEGVGLAGCVEHDSLLPSLCAGFGFRYAYGLRAGTSAMVMGVEGLSVDCVAMVANPIDWRETEAGNNQHIAVAAYGQPPMILEQLAHWRATLHHDDLFLTNPTTLSAIRPTLTVYPSTAVQWGEFWAVEAEYARLRAEGLSCAVPFLALQQAYYDSSMRGALGQLLTVQQDELIDVTPQFHITAIKPREDGSKGVIVRGVNTSHERIEVRLKLWRRFEECVVVRLDERPSDAALPIDDDGAIRFMAAPSRLLTLWFY